MQINAQHPVSEMRCTILELGLTWECFAHLGVCIKQQSAQAYRPDKGEVMPLVATWYLLVQFKLIPVRATQNGSVVIINDVAATNERTSNGLFLASRFEHSSFMAR